MADYPIIADVSNYIIKTLRKKMCPEPIPSPNNIEVSSPADQDVDYILGLYLYDIKEEGDFAKRRKKRGNGETLGRNVKTPAVRWTAGVLLFAYLSNRTAP